MTNNFERNKDPRKSLEIGFFRPRNFSDINEASTWVMQNFTKILGIDYLPDPYPSPEQLEEIREFVQKFVFIDEIHLGNPGDMLQGIKNLYSELHEVRGSLLRSLDQNMRKNEIDF